MLDHYSSLSKAFRMARDWSTMHNSVNFHLRLHSKRKTTRQYNAPTVSEVAALIVNDFGDGLPTRDIIINSKDNGLKRVSELHPSFMALQYPLLFPYEEDGFHDKIPYHTNTGAQKTKRGYVTMKEYYSYIIQQWPNESSTLLRGGRLFQQYLVDAYTTVEEQRLNWTRNNQDTLRVELYHNLCDAVTRGDTSAVGLGKRIVLPRTFTGSLRYMMQNYQDAMALCRTYDNPDLFITFTSNPKWPEISKMLSYFPGQKSHDRPEIGTRVFKIKLTELLDDLMKKHVFGESHGVVYVIEFQKRGLPHAHILLWLEEHCKCKTPSDIDDIISAKLPSPTDDPDAYKTVTDYMLHGPCGKDARNATCTADGKCPDRATIVIKENVKNGTTVAQENVLEVDEIKNYLNCRFLAPCEAVWRLFSFDIHYSYPTVMQLSFHLPNQNAITLRDSEKLPALLQKEGIDVTMFTDWFELNKCDPAARAHTYAEITKHYVWHEKDKLWKQRKQRKCIGRLIYSSLASGERYYLKMLLNVVRGVQGFKELMTVNNRLYATFKETSFAYGLLNDDREWTHALSEASLWALGPQLRDIFVTMLLFCDVSRPLKLWEENWQTLAEDILHKKCKLFNYPELQLKDEQICNYCLMKIKELLHKYGMSLANFKDLPQPDLSLLTNMGNRLIREALDFDIKKSKVEHEQLHSLLNPKQRVIYEDVVQSVHNKKGKFYFVYGPGGTGNTFLYKKIISRLRSKRKIVLAVASSGIASLLLPAGRTAHSRFVIPLELMENSTCGIKQNTQLAELMQEVQLIIWDEAPMTQRYAFEALDITLRDILGFKDSERRQQIFKGMTVLLGGNFRQILPVIPKAKRPEVVQACINRKVLDKNMGLPYWKIVEETYPDFTSRRTNDGYIKEKAILTPRNKDADAINKYMFKKLPGEVVTYNSADEICKASTDNIDQLYPVEFLNSLNFPEYQYPKSASMCSFKGKLKCLADANLHVPLDEIKVDKTLRFVEEPLEIMDREVKTLKRSKIPIVKVRWNSKRGPEFTWEREDHMKAKYPQLFENAIVETNG
ncbi:DNA helicase PIF1, ATP-dependent [Tanacetum coccineum]